MNLEKLFKIQAELDKRIVEKHGLQNEDLLDKKILALQVELGELANEWRGFKFWSKDQKARKEIKCHACNGRGKFQFIENDLSSSKFEICAYCEGTGIQARPLLEEYVDGLHFILDIGLEKDFVKLGYNESAVEGMKRKDITSQFNYLFDKVGDFSSIPNHNNYMYIVPLFIGLGEMLGFTWEQIEEAYLTKNKINHERQESGY